MNFLMKENDQINWDQYIDAYRESGLSLKIWCEENHVSIDKMKYQMYSKKKSNTSMAKPMEINFEDEPASSHTIIKLGEFEIEVNHSNIDIVSQLIKRVVYD